MDIGEGEDSIRYARRFPHARIFAFEPLPANQRVLRENLARYAVPNVELVPLALSDRAGDAVFHVSSGRPPVEFSGHDWNYGNKSSSLLPPAGTGPMHGWIEIREKITVACGTLDAFCAARGIDRIDFIHMDVQGAESRVLDGASRLLSRITAVWLEVANVELYRGQPLRGAIEARMRARPLRRPRSRGRPALPQPPCPPRPRLPACLPRSLGLAQRPRRRRPPQANPAVLPMIITRLTGGLGNQMFQYAAGLALAEHRRSVLKLDVSWFREYAEYEAHNRYALSCFNVAEQFATQEEIDRVRGVALTRAERWSVALARRLHFYRYAGRYAAGGHLYRAPGAEFTPDFFDQPDNTMLEGMWQSEQFFASIAPLLRLHFSFRYPPQPSVVRMAERIREGGPSVAVHFRRGDYVRNPVFQRELGVLPLDYYARAIALVRQHAPEAVLYLFSDDINAVEQEFHPQGPHVFVRATEPWHSFDEIRLMSACDHLVISNSTFAWWAAWLNPAPHKVVVAPKLWRGDSPEEWRHAIPATWTAL